MSEKITREKFIERMGREPRDDDMDRVNCPEAGKPGHYACGWCETHDLPQFKCACLVIKNQSSRR